MSLAGKMKPAAGNKAGMEAQYGCGKQLIRWL